MVEITPPSSRANGTATLQLAGLPSAMHLSVTLKCIADGKPASWSVAVPFAREDGGVISTMWARRTIQSLEEVNNLGRYPKGTDAKRVRAEIVNLSKQFNL